MKIYENVTILTSNYFHIAAELNSHIKPEKYGIQVWWACDSKTKLPLQGTFYTGKDAGAEREVKQGVKDYHRKSDYRK